MEEVHNTHDPLMKKKDMMMREKTEVWIMEQEARAETKKQQESELVAEQKSWSLRKKRKPCCSLAQDLEETSYARLFFLYEPVTTISAKQQYFKSFRRMHDSTRR